jgi:hypothetical protein
MREGRGAGEPQPHQPAAAGGDSAHTADGVVDAGQDPRGLGLQKLACGGEGYLSCGAVEERDVQFCFQLPDRMRQHRLRHVQLLGGAPEVAGLGHHREIA